MSQRYSLKIVSRMRCALKNNNFKVCLLLFPLETRIFNQYLTKTDKGLESTYVSFSVSHLTDFVCPASRLADGSYVTLGSSVPRSLYSKATKFVFEHINLQYCDVLVTLKLKVGSPYFIFLPSSSGGQIYILLAQFVSSNASPLYSNTMTAFQLKCYFTM